MTKFKLPVVTEGTRHSVARNAEQNPAYVENLVRRYGEENPMVTDWISQYMSTLPPEYGKPIVEAAILTMRLLESQGEANTLCQENRS